MVAEELDRLRAYEARKESLDPDWVSAAVSSDSSLRFRPDELRALAAELQQVLARVVRGRPDRSAGPARGQARRRAPARVPVAARVPGAAMTITAERPVAETTPRSAFREPQFLRYLTGQTISGLGDQIWFVALSWSAVRLASPATAGLLLMLSSVPGSRSCCSAASSPTSSTSGG
jgi:hypothetical protein